jgi:DNA-directed RNA polymerase specialized sigma24 family protein
LNLIAINDALSGLENIESYALAHWAEFVGGLSNEDAAVVLGVPPATLQTQWADARASMLQAMKKGDAR